MRVGFRRYGDVERKESRGCEFEERAGIKNRFRSFGAVKRFVDKVRGEIKSDLIVSREVAEDIGDGEVSLRVG